jgi:tetratricopeptide (TPR) repeat protein
MTPRLQQLMEYYDADPTDPFILFAVAKEHEKLGDTQTALEWYTNLQFSHSDYIGVYYHLGKLYETMENYTEAKRMYSEGLVVAKNKNDFHAASELNNAKLNLEDIVDSL